MFNMILCTPLIATMSWFLPLRYTISWSDISVFCYLEGMDKGEEMSTCKDNLKLWENIIGGDYMLIGCLILSTCK